MQLIECPWCGPREETEFHYGGQAHVAYPEDPQALTDEQWAHYVFFRSNPKGLFAERWSHSARLPPMVQRRSRHRHLPIPAACTARTSRGRRSDERTFPHQPRVAASTATPRSPSSSTTVS